MRGLRLQFVLTALTASLWLSCLGCHSGNKDLKCIVNYLDSMTCCWSSDVSHTGSQCELWVDDPDEKDEDEDEDEPEFPKRCSPKNKTPSSSKRQERRCHLDIPYFAAAQEFNITLLCSRNGSQVTVAWIPDFRPFRNIKPKAPYNLTVTNNSRTQTDFVWLTYHELLFADKLEFEMRYKTEDENWKDAKTLQIMQHERKVSIDSSNLKAVHLYEAQIRTKITDRDPDGYNSMWSEWSHVVKWKSKVPTPPVGIIRLTLVSALFVVGFLVVVTFLTIRQLTIKRYSVKKLNWLSIPDPGKFFYELNSTYGGNFQKWLGTTFPASFSSTEDLGTEISSVEISEIKESESFIKQEYVSDSSGFKSIGNSSLASFANQGYFWFSYPSAYEVDSCKVYFSYDRNALRSGSEQSGSYRCLTSSNDSLYDSSHQYSPCSVFEKDLAHGCFLAQTGAGALTGEGRDSLPRGPEDPRNRRPLQFSREFGNIGQLLRNGCPAKESHGCLNATAQVPLFEAFHYPFISMADIAIKKKQEGVSRCGSDDFMFEEIQTDPLPTSTETALSVQCPEDGFRQESTSIFKTASLNLGQSTDAYLSLKEVQSKYSNQSI
ncbi:interleukin-2 receptor subunit beta-like [Cetorhinus maximus]